MFSTDVHVCISIVLYIYPLTHQCHPFIIFKAFGFPSHLYKSMPVFHWNKLVLDSAISLELFEFAAILGTLHSLFSSMRHYHSLLPITALNWSPQGDFNSMELSSWWGVGVLPSLPLCPCSLPKTAKLDYNYIYYWFFYSGTNMK